MVELFYKFSLGQQKGYLQSHIGVLNNKFTKPILSP